MGMTPCVEAVAEEQIGIKKLDYDQNSRAMLELLIDEINEKTPYVFRLIPWMDYASEHHRILVKKKPRREALLIRAIQLLGLEKGVSIPKSAIDAALSRLWNESPASD